MSFGTIYYHVMLSLVWTISHIPFRMLYILSDILYYPFYYIVRYRRKMTRKNLTETFADRSEDEIIKIEKRFYHFFIDMILESCKLISISPEDMKKHVRFTNIDLVNGMLAEGKSVSGFLGHYGNWEWISSIGLWLDKSAGFAQIYHKLRNKQMDRIMLKLRTRMGGQCVGMYQTVRFIANAANENKPYVIGFIADQSPKKREVKHYMQFLNHNIPVLTGTEKVTKHFGYCAVFVSIQRIKRGYYECKLTPLHDDPKSLPDFELTSLYYQRLEQEIMQHPEYYLWTHNRFKYAVQTNNQ